MSAFDFTFTESQFASSTRADVVGKLATQEELTILAEELAKGLQTEFAQGGHNRSGDTVESVKVHLGPMSAEVSMAGGATFVEYGFRPHYIEATNALALHWEGDNKFQEGFARPGIQVSGYQGDPFVERALEKDINYNRALDDIANKIFMAYLSDKRLKITMLTDTSNNEEAMRITDTLPPSDFYIKPNEVDQMFSEDQ